MQVPSMTLRGAKTDDLDSPHGKVMNGSITDAWHPLNLTLASKTFNVEYQEIHNAMHPDYKYALRSPVKVESTVWEDVFFGGHKWDPTKVVLAYPPTPNPYPLHEQAPLQFRQRNAKNMPVATCTKQFLTTPPARRPQDL
eukprot:2216283-Rhodomonas_salina.1